MTTVNWELVRKLKLIGLEENEARGYLASLELGPASMWEVYQRSFIKRTTCYQTFEKFLQRGIATKSFDGKRTIYSVVHPSDLIMSLDHQKELFTASLPQFDALLAKSGEKPEIRIYRGFEGVKQAYYLGLSQPEGSENLICGTAKIWLENKEENDAYIAERLRKKIRLRIIFADEKINYALLPQDKRELRQTRFLPKKIYDPAVETNFFSNTVVFIAHSEREPFATVVENAAIAQTEKQKFELLWKMAKEKYGQKKK